jgi:hypothetical protein
MRRAIFLYGGVHGEEEEFLLGLCAGYEEFDITGNMRRRTHECLQTVKGVSRVQGTTA